MAIYRTCRLTVAMSSPTAKRNSSNIMKGWFLKKVVSDHIAPQTANDMVIKRLMVDMEKMSPIDGDDLEDAYVDTESMITKLPTLVMGGVYIFGYDAKTPQTYTYGGRSIQFTDTMPMVLVTQVGQKSFRGVNLNLCPPALRIVILSFICDLDEDFYQGGYVRMFHEGEPALSKKVLMFFAQGGEKVLCDYLGGLKQGVDFRGVFRSYSFGLMDFKNIRYIEPWAWHAIPSVDYRETIRKDVLEMIWKLNGMSSI